MLRGNKIGHCPSDQRPLTFVEFSPYAGITQVRFTGRWRICGHPLSLAPQAPVVLTCLLHC